MGVYEYESQLADLSNRYANKSATDDYARILGQQRFSRNKRDFTQGYQQNFPKFTGQWAGRLGNQVQSGVFRQQLTEGVNKFNQGLGDMEADQAGSEGQYFATQARDQSQYQQGLLRLQEELARQRASVSPFVNVTGP